MIAFEFFLDDLELYIYEMVLDVYIYLNTE